MLSSGKCETEFQYASTVCPESVRPLLSTMVKESITGTRRLPPGAGAAAVAASIPKSSNNPAMAKSAALELSESNTVSTSSRSAPPSNNPRACS